VSRFTICKGCPHLDSTELYGSVCGLDREPVIPLANLYIDPTGEHPSRIDPAILVSDHCRLVSYTMVDEHGIPTAYYPAVVEIEVPGDDNPLPPPAVNCEGCPMLYEGGDPPRYLCFLEHEPVLRIFNSRLGLFAADCSLVAIETMERGMVKRDEPERVPNQKEDKG